MVLWSLVLRVCFVVTHAVVSPAFSKRALNGDDRAVRGSLLNADSLHMLFLSRPMKVYCYPSPNALKVALLLEQSVFPSSAGAGGYAQKRAAFRGDVA
jgi:hypothetical protein